MQSFVIRDNTWHWENWLQAICGSPWFWHSHYQEVSPSELCRVQKVGITGSWSQRPELNRWTWYINAREIAKDNYHIIVNTCWRILQNCKVSQVLCSLQLITDLLLLYSNYISSVEETQDAAVFIVLPSETERLHMCTWICSEVSNQFNVFTTLEDPVQLWDTFKCKTIEAARECIGEHPRSRCDFASEETLETERNRTARHAGNQDCYRALLHRTRALLRRDKGRYVRSLTEEVEGYFNVSDFQPSYWAQKKLCSMSASWINGISAADGFIMSDMDGQKLC